MNLIFHHHLLCETPGPYSLADENILKNSFISCGFKDMNIERINVSFEFDSAEEYTNFTKDIAAPVLAMLSDQTLDRKVQIWKAVTEAAKKYVKNNTDSIVLDNEAYMHSGPKTIIRTPKLLLIYFSI